MRDQAESLEVQLYANKMPMELSAIKCNLKVNYNSLL